MQKHLPPSDSKNGRKGSIFDSKSRKVNNQPILPPGEQTSQQCVPGNFSKNVISQQKRRITEFWPSTTPDARNKFPDFCAMYECIKEHGTPNFLGAKIPIQSDLVISKWEELLVSYHDKDLVPFLKYGWPMGYHADQPPSSVEDNHPSATQHLNHVKTFVQKELQHKAILGPLMRCLSLHGAEYHL